MAVALREGDCSEYRHIVRINDQMAKQIYVERVNELSGKGNLRMLRLDGDNEILRDR